MSPEITPPLPYTFREWSPLQKTMTDIVTNCEYRVVHRQTCEALLKKVQK
jgi:hypothetical protein